MADYDPRAQRRLHLRAYRHGDARKILPRWDFQREHEAEGSPLFGAGPEGPTWTLVQGPDDATGRPLACGGAVDRGEGVWTLWGYAGALSWRQWQRAAEGLALMIERLGRMGAREAQALVRADFPEAAFFLARLGAEARADAAAEAEGCRLMVFRLKGEG